MKGVKKATIFGVLMLFLFSVLSCDRKDVNEPQQFTICTEEEIMNEVKTAVQLFEYGRESEIDFNIMTLPKDVSERESACKKLRTELMSGEGPDIYILSDQSREKGVLEEVKEPLLEDPNKVLYSGVLADLSEYTEKDKEFKTCFKPVMKAGEVDGQQMIIPFTFNFSLLSIEEEQYDKSFFKLEDCRTPLVKLIQEEEKLKSVDPYIFFLNPKDWIGKAVDYEKQNLLISEKEIRQVLQYGVARYQKQDFPKETRFEITDANSEKRKNLDANENTSAYRYIPMFSLDGKPTARVTAYGAVSAGCKDIESAYDFLKLFLQKDFASGKGWKGKSEAGSEYFVGENGIFLMEGVPVQQAAWEEWFVKELGIGQKDEVTENQRVSTKNFVEAAKMVSNARFQNAMDTEGNSIVKLFLAGDGYTFKTDFPDMEERIDEAAKSIYNSAYYTAME